MALTSFTSLALAIALSLTLASSPILLGLWVLGLALTLSLLIALIIAPWLGIITFLIYVGGLLVIFAYFVALAPNQLLEAKTMFILLLITHLTALTILTSAPLTLNVWDFGPVPLPHSSLTMLVQSTNSFIYIALALILFLALVAVVKIRTISSGPLRPFS